MKRANVRKVVLLRLLVPLLVAVAIAGACARPGPAPTAQPIKIGVTAPLTGSIAYTAEQGQKMMNALAKDLNAKGGINGRPLEFLWSNNEADATKALADIKRFVEMEKVPLVVPYLVTGIQVAVAKWAEENKFPAVGSAAGDATVGYNWYVNTIYIESETARAVLGYAQKNGWKTMGLLAITLAYGKGAVKVVENLAPEYGIKIVETQYVEPGTTDVTVQLAKLRAGNPDFAYTAPYPAEGALILKTMLTMGWTPPIMQTLAGDIVTMVPPQAARNMFWFEAFDPTAPAVKEAFDKYQAEYGVRLETSGGVFGAQLFTLIVGVLKASGGDFKPQTIRDAIVNYRGPMVCGKRGATFNFEPPHRNYALVAADLVGLMADEKGQLVPLSESWTRK